MHTLNAKTWERLLSWRARLPHALLLTGPRGLGKLALAQAFAAGLLCEQAKNDGRACGTCLPCGWFRQGNHPDYRLIQPEALESDEAEEAKKKTSRQITIDPIRALDEFLNVGTHRAGLRIVLIHPAEAMNRNAANALLKSLEEPPADTLFLLVSHEPQRLLPTLRSRCQQLGLTLPPREEALAFLTRSGLAKAEDWLALAGGAPLLALELAGSEGWLERYAGRLAEGGECDALRAAAEMDKLLRDTAGKTGLRQVVEWAQKWTLDLILAKEKLPVRYFSRHRATMTAMIDKVATEKLLRFYRRLIDARRQVEQPLNARLFLEAFFLDYRQLFARDRP